MASWWYFIRLWLLSQESGYWTLYSMLYDVNNTTVIDNKNDKEWQSCCFMFVTCLQCWKVFREHPESPHRLSILDQSFCVDWYKNQQGVLEGERGPEFLTPWQSWEMLGIWGYHFGSNLGINGIKVCQSCDCTGFEVKDCCGTAKICLDTKSPMVMQAHVHELAAKFIGKNAVHLHKMPNSFAKRDILVSLTNSGCNRLSEVYDCNPVFHMQSV